MAAPNCAVICHQVAADQCVQLPPGGSTGLLPSFNFLTISHNIFCMFCYFAVLIKYKGFFLLKALQEQNAVATNLVLCTSCHGNSGHVLFFINYHPIMSPVARAVIGIQFILMR